MSTKKKDIVLKGKNKNHTPLFIIIGMLAVAIIGAIGFSISPSQDARTLPFATTLNPVDYSGKLVDQTKVLAQELDNQIAVPLSYLEQYNFIYFQSSQTENSLPLTAYVAPSGKVITAVSICEPCNSDSFHIDGDILVCNACGTRWKLETLEGISGGCQDFPPDPLESSVVDGKIIISKELVADWQPRV